MTRRQHILLDAFIQAAILIFYALLIAQSEHPFLVLGTMVLFLFGWQFINSVLNYKFFEGRSRISFVRVAAYSLVGVFLFWGLMLVISFILFSIPGLSGLAELFPDFINKATTVFWMIMPYYFGALSVWGLYLSGRDVYTILFKTI